MAQAEQISRQRVGMPRFGGATNIAQVNAPRPVPGQAARGVAARGLPTMPRFSGPPSPAARSGLGRALAPVRDLANRAMAPAARAYNAVSGGLAGNRQLLAGMGGAGMYGTRIPGTTGAVADALIKGVAAPLAAGVVNRYNLQNFGPRTHEYQRARLLGGGWYTPSAQLRMQSVPARYSDSTQGRAQYYDRENLIGYPPKYWLPESQGGEPEYKIQEDMRHEYGHYFDVGPQGGWYSSNPQFISAAKQTDAEFFPGMGLKPGVGARTGGFLGIGNTPGWGGPPEAYAYAGQNPYWFRKLSQWYPQYGAQAYQMPAFAGDPNNPINGTRIGGDFFAPTPGRGPYTDISNFVPGKRISAPTEPLYYNYQRGQAPAP